MPGGALLVQWDVATDSFPQGVVTAMFEAFKGLIEGACRPGALNAEADVFPAHQRAQRAAVNATFLRGTGR